MKVITHEQISQLNIDPNVWFEWAGHVLENKHKYIMPAKTSIHYDSSYFNTMPSVLPEENIMGVKVVNRYLGRIPSLDSQLLLYDYTTGENLALMDASLITAMRTGAVTVHAMDMFANSNFKEVGIMGFGNIGIACLEVMLAHYKNHNFKLKMLRYKDHAEKALERFKKYTNVEFVIVETVEEIIKNSDVIISCITYTDQLLGEESWFKEGCLVLPVHLRGFQNCDLFFDKVYGDDYGQLKGFQYFDQFKSFAETAEVLRGEKAGRENSKERILSYNVGMSLHDIYAAAQIYKSLEKVEDIERLSPSKRYWL
jgi:ornithine cyclodeaminase/alanine dehydrogenase